MKRLLTVTVAIMILLWMMPSTLTAHASTGLLIAHFRTDLVKGTMPTELEDGDTDESLSADEIIVDEMLTEPEEPDEPIDTEPAVADDVADAVTDTADIDEPIATDIATSIDMDADPSTDEGRDEVENIETEEAGEDKTGGEDKTAGETAETDEPEEDG